MTYSVRIVLLLYAAILARIDGVLEVLVVQHLMAFRAPECLQWPQELEERRRKF
jgi:hypothetical protein